MRSPCACHALQVCGDGEYVIYTALAWRNKSFGQVRCG